MSVRCGVWEWHGMIPMGYWTGVRFAGVYVWTRAGFLWLSFFFLPSFVFSFSTTITTFMSVTLSRYGLVHD